MRFISEKELRALEDGQAALRANMSETQLEIAKESDKVLDNINSVVSDFDAEARIRKANLTQQDAENMAKIIEREKIKSGTVFMFTKNDGDTLVFARTPFNTVVQAQVYVDSLQDSLITIDKKNREFTSLSFFGLIKLAFTNLTKGKRNG